MPTFATTRDLQMQTARIPYAETGRFSRLINDYLAKDEGINPFYNRFPSLENLDAQRREKASFKTPREILVRQLEAQYKSLGKVPENVYKLLNPNAFTITTGHQLCLFSGPLYFIYKIVSAVNLCAQLAEKFTEQQFVPVFWMASEDHDFAEVNHTWVGERKLEWESGQAGAVGRMKLEGIEEVLDQLEEILDIGPHREKLIQLFRNCYQPEKDLAFATRKLVHALFGEYGVVVIDGDDIELKRCFAPFVKRELFENVAFKAISETNAALPDIYPRQVSPREINLFYLADQYRDRIVKQGNKFQALHSDISFSKEELESELELHPERFSPNVVLRPLYQEIILPNLAYIGGGGELAYWMQLKRMFADFEVPFPVLVLRNSVGWLSEKANKKRQQLGLDFKELFNEQLALEKILVQRQSDVESDFQEEWKVIKSTLAEIESKMKSVDKSLEGAAEAVKAKTERLIKRLEKKMVNAQRHSDTITTARLNLIYDELFPNDQLQERRLNFSPFFSAYGADFIKELLLHLKPLDFRFTILVED